VPGYDVGMHPWNAHQGFLGIPNVAPAAYQARAANPAWVPWAIGGAVVAAGAGAYAVCRPKVLREKSVLTARTIAEDHGCFNTGFHGERYSVDVFFDGQRVPELSQGFKTKKAAVEYFDANTKDKDESERAENPVWPWLVGAAVVAAGAGAYAYCRSRVVFTEKIEADIADQRVGFSRKITHNGCFADKKYTAEFKAGKVTYTEDFDTLEEAKQWGEGGQTPEGGNVEGAGGFDEAEETGQWGGKGEVGKKLLLGSEEAGVHEQPITLKFTTGEVSGEWKRPTGIPSFAKEKPVPVTPFGGANPVGEISYSAGNYYYTPLWGGRHRMTIGDVESLVDVPEKSEKTDNPAPTPGFTREGVHHMVQHQGYDVERFEGEARVWAQEAQNAIERAFNSGWNDGARGMYRPRGLRHFYDAGARAGNTHWQGLGA